ncbi:MAG: amidohydrolase family protein, partial [Pyrinomonadaceae bacterium]|nr:amidohydrolase family protein [Pyrinomonadaceae bacterium]
MKKLLLMVIAVMILANVAGAQVTAIRAGRMVDPETGRVESNQVIIVDGQDIKSVGSNVAIPAGATVVDLSRYTVMPGMMDAHTHLCINMQHQRDANSYYITTLRDSNAKRAIQGVVNARSMLEYGFTSIRDVGNEGNYACVEVGRAVNQSLIDGPLMITAGRIIAPYGGQFGLQPDKQNL